MKTAIAAAGIALAAVAFTVLGCGRRAAPVMPQELVLDLGNKVTMKLVIIPVGKFMMGSPADEKNRKDEETQHEVAISTPFFMGVHEVTRGQFTAFVKDTSYHTEAEKDGWAWTWDGTGYYTVKGASWKKPGFVQTDEHPVVCVSWNDATAFCKWLSEKSGKTVRLPTEAEWEYACRAGTKTAYQWGNDPDEGKGWCNGRDKTAKKTLGDRWNCFNWDDGFTFTAPVGQFKPNAFGLCDMDGNVEEWCGDWWGDYEHQRQTDPTGAATGKWRVLRDGAWGTDRTECRAAFRDLNIPSTARNAYGFRVVLVDF